VKGYTAYYYNDKIKGFNIARKETGEVQNQIRRLSGKNYLNRKTPQLWVKKYEEVIRGVNGFVNYIRNNPNALALLRNYISIYTPTTFVSLKHCSFS
jgi:23S rRNA-intervening sequence protein